MTEASQETSLSGRLYPLLAAMAPVISLAAVNIEQIRLSALVLPLIVVLAGASIAIFFARKLLPSDHGAAVWATLSIVLFFAHGHILSSIPFLYADTGHFVLVLCWAILLIATNMFLRRFPERAFGASRFAAIFVFLFFALATGQFAVAFWSKHGGTTHPVLPALTTNTNGTERNIVLPDIYYIILDGYAREDRMKQVCQFDNSEFIEGLRDRGFYVADKSRCNYAMTFLSLASSLNMRYLDKEAADAGIDGRSRTAPYELIKNNLVGRYLQSSGYRYVHIRTNWGGTEASSIADESYPRTLSEFSEVLINTTPLVPIVDEFHLQRDKLILAQLESIKQASQSDKPKFVFSHLICPHPPYCFTKDGDIVPEGGDDSDANIDGYVGQVQFINTQVEIVIDTIIKNSKHPPIIVIQADHGTASNAILQGSSDAEQKLIQERMTILNAYLVPESCRAKLYPAITPVNSFRLILGDLFQDDQFPQLADRCSFSWYERPYAFQDVTDEVE